MLVVIHVSIALLSIVQAIFGLVSPSMRKLRATSVLTAATLASGTYLVWHSRAPILQACMSGLLYLSLIVGATAITYRRLAKQIN